MKNLVDNVGKLIERRAWPAARVFDSIIRTHSRDIHQIDHTLDGLLDF